MTENIEFISAKDLPEATGDEVSVLCVENGELRQKPGASLGGGSGTVLFNADDALYQESSGEILYFASYDLYKKLMDGEIVMPVVIWHNNFNYPYTARIPTAPDPESDFAEQCVFHYEDGEVYLFPSEKAAFNYYDR